MQPINTVAHNAIAPALPAPPTHKNEPSSIFLKSVNQVNAELFPNPELKFLKNAFWGAIGWFGGNKDKQPEHQVVFKEGNQLRQAAQQAAEGYHPVHFRPQRIPPSSTALVVAAVTDGLLNSIGIAAHRTGAETTYSRINYTDDTRTPE
ncbi:hypothetical protein ACQYRI_05845 [Salmonella enterica]